MDTNLEHGIIAGKTLKDWWENAPHGAFRNKCAELGIPLFFGDGTDVLGRYEVEISYRYSGYGHTHITVNAFNKKEAEKLALAKFDEHEVDTYDLEIDSLKTGDIMRKEIITKDSRVKK